MGNNVTQRPNTNFWRLKGKSEWNKFDLMSINVIFLTMWAAACTWNWWSKQRSTAGGDGTFVVTHRLYCELRCVRINLPAATNSASHTGECKGVSLYMFVCELYFSSEPVRNSWCTVSVVWHTQNQLHNTDQINAVCFSQMLNTQIKYARLILWREESSEFKKMNTFT